MVLVLFYFFRAERQQFQVRKMKFWGRKNGIGFRRILTSFERCEKGECGHTPVACLLKNHFVFYGHLLLNCTWRVGKIKWSVNGKSERNGSAVFADPWSENLRSWHAKVIFQACMTKGNGKGCTSPFILFGNQALAEVLGVCPFFKRGKVLFFNLWSF